MRSANFDINATYVVDGEHAARLAKINEALYDDKPMTPDRRRDLANSMDALLHYLERMPD